ncbi:tetratricopeptide repeat protein [Calycomorphotria hydatis]|uniref:Tetratricopeptide repeat protein n=2 Tax=Calycomorphotria hydatis TaxID=2528027 RepID=A0A517T3D7_9PLAN|nr:tetratricopeptide repeat protein [Calycomorphotria hydatis]
MTPSGPPSDSPSSEETPRPLEHAFHINWILLGVLMAGLVIVVTGGVILHRMQVAELANTFSRQAAQAEADGDFKLAISRLEQYLRFRPKDDAARRRFALLVAEHAISPRDYLHAFDRLEEVLRIRPTDEEVRRELTKVAMALRRYRDAVEHLSLLLQTYNHETELHYRLGRCYEELRESANAVAAYELALKTAPLNIDAARSLARVMRRDLSRPNDADAVMNQLVAQSPHSHRTLVARGRYFLRLGHLSRAEADARRARRMAPSDVEVLLLQAELTELGAENSLEVDQLRRELREKMEAGTDDERIVLALARLELAGDNAEKAIATILDAIREDPEQLPLQWSLADIYLSLGRVEDADRMVAHLQSTTVPGEILDYLKARREFVQGRLKTAVHLFETVRPKLQEYPTLQTAVDVHLGTAHGELGQTERQLAAFQKALSVDANNTEARAGLANALLAAGRFEDAIAQYRQVADQPETSLAMARALLANGMSSDDGPVDWEEISRAIDRASLAGSDPVQILLLRAGLQGARGDWEQAEKILQLGLRRYPGKAQLWAALSDIQLREGHVEKSQELLEQAESQLGRLPELLMEKIRLITFGEADAALDELKELEPEVAALEKTPAQSKLQWAMVSAYESLGATDHATAYLLSLAEGDSNDLSLWRRLLALALANNDKELVEQSLSQMREIEGENGIFLRLGEAQWKAARGIQGNTALLAEAKLMLEDLAVDFPSAPELLLTQARIALAERHPEAALEKLMQAIEAGARSPALIEQTVRMLYSRDRFVDAGRLLRLVTRQDQLPFTIRFHRLAGRVEMTNGEVATALSHARKVISSPSADIIDRLWYAQLLTASGKTEEAEEYFKKLLADFSSESRVWAAWIEFLAQQERVEEAEREMVRMEETLGDQSIGLLAQCCELVGRYDDAEKYYIQAIKDDAGDCFLLSTAANFFLRRGDTPRSRELMQRILNGESCSPTLQRRTRRTLAAVNSVNADFRGYMQAIDLLDQNLSNEREREDLISKATLLATHPLKSARRDAVSLLLEADALQPLKTIHQLQLVQLLIDQGDIQQASDALRPLLTYTGSHSRMYLPSIRTMLRLGESTGLINQWIDDFVRSSPNSLEALELRMRVIVLREGPHAAINMLNTAMEEVAAQPEQHLSLERWAVSLLEDIANGLEKTGRTVTAETILDHAEERYRNYTESHPEELVNLVRLLRRRWKLAEAMKLIDRVWKNTPPEFAAVEYVSLLRLPSVTPDDFQRVEQLLVQTREENPNSAELIFQHANLLHLQHQFAEAAELYEQALRLSPGSVLIRNEFAMLLALRGQRLDRAEELITTAIDSAGPRPFLLDTRAVVRLARNDPAAALKDLQQAIDSEPTPVKLFHQTQAYLQLNEQRAAARSFDEAIAAGLHPDALHPLERPQLEELRATLQN